MASHPETADPVEKETAADKPVADHPSQSEMPFAIVQGRYVTELPKDLYIPPEALEVFLETFEGPLDLLLYMIRRQNLDVLEINVADITKQYMAYIDLMEAMQFELAAEYLLMAAMLAEIKSRMLLPRQVAEEEEDDPRAELIRRLQEYERFKKAAEDLEGLPRLGRDIFLASAREPERSQEKPQPPVEMKELLISLAAVLRRVEMYESHRIQLEPLSTRERMSQVLERLRGQQFLPFVSLFTLEEWKQLLLRSIGLEPAALSERGQAVALLRMVPFVERNYNLVELGPRGTGKSHLYQQISPYAHLISGGKASVARMFVDNNSGQRGLVCQYDVLCFDEVSGISFDNKDGVNIMKGYMESGEFSRGRESIRADGNTVRRVPSRPRGHALDGVCATRARGRLQPAGA